MRRIISVSLLALSLTAALIQVPAYAATEDKPLELATNAPERHVVVPGDTLWGISSKFLKQPYRWPELWRMNADEVKNPHLIYPGQVLVLEIGADGKPRLRTEGSGPPGKLEPKIYLSESRKPITSIPHTVIQPYLAEPLVLNNRDLATLPHIVGVEEARTVAGSGDDIFVAGIKQDDSATVNWNIYRPGSALRAPGNRTVLGYEATHLGTARLVLQGNPSKLLVTRSKMEIQAGDLLVPQPPPTLLSYVPHRPNTDVRASVLTVYAAVGLGGQYSIISLSKGKQDGLEIGHVLALMSAGKRIDDRFNGRYTRYTSPDERVGLAFVFQVFDQVSYALIVNSDLPIAIGDVLVTP